MTSKPSIVPTYIAWVVAILGIITALFSAGSQWGDVKARITNLEQINQYYHGSNQIPK